jgi:hypothetical protein
LSDFSKYRGGRCSTASRQRFSLDMPGETSRVRSASTRPCPAARRREAQTDGRCAASRGHQDAMRSRLPRKGSSGMSRSRGVQALRGRGPSGCRGGRQGGRVHGHRRKADQRRGTGSTRRDRQSLDALRTTPAIPRDEAEARRYTRDRETSGCAVNGGRRADGGPSTGLAERRRRRPRPPR